MGSISVLGARRSSVALVAGQDAMLLIPRGTGHEAQWELPDVLKAPLFSQEAVGNVCYVNDFGEELCLVELLPAEDVPEARLADYTLLVLAGWIHG